jgi:hypothetical protein
MTIVDLKQRRARRDAHLEVIRDAEHRLHEIGDELFSLAVGVAMTGELYDWNEAQPIGSFANLDELLAGVRDGRVVALLQLRASIAFVIEHLRGPA